jgi:hypothetical protein
MRRFPEAVVAYKKASDLDPSNLDLKNKLRDAEEAQERSKKVRTNPDGVCIRILLKNLEVTNERCTNCTRRRK